MMKCFLINMSSSVSSHMYISMCVCVYKYMYLKYLIIDFHMCVIYWKHIVTYIDAHINKASVWGIEKSFVTYTFNRWRAEYYSGNINIIFSFLSWHRKVVERLAHGRKRHPYPMFKTMAAESSYIRPHHHPPPPQKRNMSIGIDYVGIMAMSKRSTKVFGKNKTLSETAKSK